MRSLLVIALMVLAVDASADVGWAKVKRIPRALTIAVIDTGIDSSLLSKDTYCKFGHKDFTFTGMNDTHGHGTHISGIIDQYAKDFVIKSSVDAKKLEDIKFGYCQVILKYYDSLSKVDPIEATIQALRYAINIKVDVINYSAGGGQPNPREKKLIQEAIDKGIKVVVAAGNEHNDIVKKPYYPASYDSRLYVVGSYVDNSRKVAEYSNVGKIVNTWEVGSDVFSRLPKKQSVTGWGTMSGTSQATAVKSGKIIHETVTKWNH